MNTKVKTTTLYVCQNCDAQYPKWQGQCLECGHWGTVQPRAVAGKIGNKQAQEAAPGRVVQLQDIAVVKENRYQTGIKEFDRVMGGGIVPGSVTLLSGDPGIGKSTLLLQVVLRLAGQTLYVSGEESAEQVKMRLDRLQKTSVNLQFLAEDQVEVIIKTITSTQPRLVVVDSIQTVFTADVPSEAGLVNQIKASTTKLMHVAKTEGIPMIIVGHVTKDGAVAGPKTLEHLVDTVLYLEGDKYQSYRLLRTAKNRFGSTAEVGVFDMHDDGLTEVPNPSENFLQDRFPKASGSVITAVLEGSRAFLIEVQALVTKTVFGYPQRKASGFDVNRLQVLLAVLGKRAGLDFGSFDVHINIVGGLKVQDPANDLAICMALASALRNKPCDAKTVALGEVGLAGEVRRISHVPERVQEAERLGFTTIIGPEMKLKRKTRVRRETVRHITEAIKVL